MSTDIQIRGVPERIRDRVKRRAAKKGKSMSEYLLDLIRRDLELPTPEEFYARLRRQPTLKLKASAAGIIRKERNVRDRELQKRISASKRK